MSLLKETKYLVIGGGIAGVTCAETVSFYEFIECMKLLLFYQHNLRKVVKLNVVSPPRFHFHFRG